MKRRTAFVASCFLASSVVAAPFVALDAAVPPLSIQQMVPTGSMPKGVIRSPDGRTLYVANYGQLDRGNLGIYDATTLARTRVIDVPGIIVESAISPDGRTLYVSNFRRNSVQYLDLASGRITREVNTGRHPKILVVSHDGRRLFAANWASRDVSEIDVATGTVTRTLAAGDNPRGMAITRSGRLYIANSTSDDIHVYEGANMTLARRLQRVCRIPRHITLAPDDSKLYISCLGAAVLAVMDTSNDRIIRRIRTESGPKANDVSPDGRYVATADYNASGVTVIDTTDWSARSIEIPLMNRASGLVFAASGLRVIVTGWFDDHLFTVGVAGAAPGLTFARRDIQRTQRQRREYDSRSGESIASTAH
ncbi:MAG: YncE family protein [Myxococcales bacterium]|nr:YncE family protein [Myxococcales bacterium]